MSVKPSARNNSSATYAGAIHIPGIFGRRMVIDSGGPSSARAARLPISPATPANDIVAANWRLLCSTFMAGILRLAGLAESVDADAPAFETTLPGQARLPLGTL